MVVTIPECSGLGVTSPATGLTPDGPRAVSDDDKQNAPERMSDLVVQQCFEIWGQEDVVGSFGEEWDDLVGAVAGDAGADGCDHEGRGDAIRAKRRD